MSAPQTSMRRSLAPTNPRVASKGFSRLVKAVPEKRVEGERPARASSYVEYRNVYPAVEVALYYGFTPLSAPLLITKRDRERARELEEQDTTEPFSIAPTLEERIALLRYYEEKSLYEGPQPAMLCAEFIHSSGLKKKSREHRLAIEVIGASKSMAEAMLIQTALSTLEEEKHENLTLFINSVGDRESMNQFVRELGSYYRKQGSSLPPSCRALLRQNPLLLLRCNHEKCRALAVEAPKSVSFLGDESRRHFKEVLEFLEELEIPYRIDSALNGSRAFATETLFEIRRAVPEISAGGPEGGGSAGVAATAEEVSLCLCSGMRYNTLGKRLGLKHDTPSVGLNLLLQHSGKTHGPHSLRFKKPSVFFLQLGLCSKLKSLRVIEVLRKARVPLYHALCRDKLISQLSSAEHQKIPYSIILGQREALENSVIVRNTETRAQETVKLHNLVDYLRKMRLC